MPLPAPFGWLQSERVESGHDVSFLQVCVQSHSWPFAVVQQRQVAPGKLHVVTFGVHATVAASVELASVRDEASLVLLPLDEDEPDDPPDEDEDDEEEEEDDDDDEPPSDAGSTTSVLLDPPQWITRAARTVTASARDTSR